MHNECLYVGCELFPLRFVDAGGIKIDIMILFPLIRALWTVELKGILYLLYVVLVLL